MRIKKNFIVLLPLVEADRKEQLMLDAILSL